MNAPMSDVHVAGGGTVFLFFLETAEARAWVDEHASPDRQFLGHGLAVERRFVADLAEGMEADGLVIDETEVR
jgi:hypothetical protein